MLFHNSLIETRLRMKSSIEFLTDGQKNSTNMTWLVSILWKDLVLKTNKVKLTRGLCSTRKLKSKQTERSPFKCRCQDKLLCQTLCFNTLFQAETLWVIQMVVNIQALRTLLKVAELGVQKPTTNINIMEWTQQVIQTLDSAILPLELLIQTWISSSSRT